DLTNSGTKERAKNRPEMRHLAHAPIDATSPWLASAAAPPHLARETARGGARHWTEGIHVLFTGKSGRGRGRKRASRSEAPASRRDGAEREDGGRGLLEEDGPRRRENSFRGGGRRRLVLRARS